ncbi:MAG: hypothetical protein ACRDJJ_00955 [Actinomycetota bacterium]
MRKIVVILLALALVFAWAAPAVARGKKKVHDTFSASLLPFPKLAAWGDLIGLTKPGCSAGQENVNWVAKPFKSPGKGTLRLYMEGFQGDHDLYVFDKAGKTALARSEETQVGTTPAPPEEEILFPLKKGQQVLLVACSWLGQPQVEAHYEGTFKT